ncbi:cytochrome P450 [Trametes versicolor FP-101664 SS1]|uniref:cytochrome P450 n=1 Tax=Trametes versicolor (strain FP-101664) TaxID=717944 RepID=UPI0004623B93|nr:cytochrome P450 [Trametes versicolor FP-101664 SS1]EIW62395.1 cytochrome P450 [Trametes versicolor FP-101664 SS1]
MYAVVWVLLVALLAAVWDSHRRSAVLGAIPVVGYSTPLLSMITALQFVRNSQRMIDEGYRKYRGGLYRIRLLAHWIVVATDAQAIEDIRRAPPDVLSFGAAQDVFLQTIHTAGVEVVHDRSHVTWIRSELTRCNAARFDALREEMAVALDEQIPLSTEWKAYPVEEVVAHVVCQMSNRLFVGEPLCRNPEYLKLAMSFANEFIRDVIVVKSCPEWLKPAVSRLLGNARKCAKRVATHLRLVIEQRDAAKRASEKASASIPDDALQWCLDNATGDARQPENLALRMLWINFGALHSPTVTLVFALYHLASSPQYVQILREEVDGVFAHEGWSKAALGKMRKLDSFLKEVLRLNPPGIWAQQRLALQPFTFSNGQTVPAGTMLACPVLSLHRDEDNYREAAEFQPWRHCEDNEAHKNLFVTTKPDFMPFGHGADACPGRFFAAIQLKALLAHIVLTYDVRFEEGRGTPERRFVAGVLLPGKADLEFRQRA